MDKAWHRREVDGRTLDSGLGWVPLLDRDSGHLIHGFCEDCAHGLEHAMHWMLPRTTNRHPSAIHPPSTIIVIITIIFVVNWKPIHHRITALEPAPSTPSVPRASYLLYDHHQHQPRAPAAARPPFGFPGSPAPASIILPPPQWSLAPNASLSCSLLAAVSVSLDIRGSPHIGLSRWPL